MGQTQPTKMNQIRAPPHSKQTKNVKTQTKQLCEKNSIPSRSLLRKLKQHSVAESSARKGQQPLGAGWAGGITPWRIGI